MRIHRPQNKDRSFNSLALLRCIDAGHSSPPTFTSMCRLETTERVGKQIRGWYLPQSPCDSILLSNLWHLWEAAEPNGCPVFAQSVLPSTAVCMNIWTPKMQRDASSVCRDHVLVLLVLKIIQFRSQPISTQCYVIGLMSTNACNP